MYINKLKEFIKNNDNISYFFTNKDQYENHVELFVNIVERFSTRNFKSTGNPQLTPEQFEMVRDEIRILMSNKKEWLETIRDNDNNKKWLNIGHVPIIYIDERGFFKIKNEK